MHALDARNQATDSLSCPESDVSDQIAMQVTTIEPDKGDVDVVLFHKQQLLVPVPVLLRAPHISVIRPSDLDDSPEVPQDGRRQARHLGSIAAPQVGRLGPSCCISEVLKSVHATLQHTAVGRRECECQQLGSSLTCASEPVWKVLPWFAFPSSSIRTKEPVAYLVRIRSWQLGSHKTRWAKFCYENDARTYIRSRNRG